MVLSWPMRCSLSQRTDNFHNHKTKKTMKKIENKEYITPQVAICDIKVEQGFAASTEGGFFLDDLKREEGAWED